MSSDRDLPGVNTHGTLPAWLVLLLLLGLYLSLRGYHSRDNDQAYRLPLLLHRQDARLFANDPFVRAFDTFNPHRGYLILLDAASRPLGLSIALFGLFVATFAATCVGVDRLARATWPEPEARRSVGLLAVALVLTAKAGNIGTNHLFEAMLLDRLIGFALGWLALGWVVVEPGTRPWKPALAIGAAALVHPSVGLQLAILLAASWIIWAALRRWSGVSWRSAGRGVLALIGGMAPAVLLHGGQGARLFEGLAPGTFWTLSVELQSPQHMLPHLWRLPQWLAFGCYLVLAGSSLVNCESDAVSTEEPAPPTAARRRLLMVMAVNLTALAMAWLAIEVWHELRVTVFQPFRMASFARGLALVFASGRFQRLWKRGGLLDRGRVVLIAAGLSGDWAFVVATLVDLSVAGYEAYRARRVTPAGSAARAAVFLITLGLGVAFLTRHDPEQGQGRLLASLAAFLALALIVRGRAPGWNRGRLGWALAGAWALPILALGAGFWTGPKPAWADALAERCRFGAVPTDDMERLAVWCRAHTPRNARFIGPPGPKTFRLWSERSLAFNRAGSPYHAAGLADWADRFRDHVGFHGSFDELVRAYQTDRHNLERRYQDQSERALVELAARQGADYVLANAPPPRQVRQDTALVLLHIEGRYAVYRVRGPGARVTRNVTSLQPSVSE